MFNVETLGIIDLPGDWIIGEYHDYEDTFTDIRDRLGHYAKLLYEYEEIIEIIAIRLSTPSIIPHGFDMGDELLHICENIITCRTEYAMHPFYPQARRFIAEYPLYKGSVTTRANAYCVLLYPEFVEMAEACFLERAQRISDMVVSRTYFSKLRNRIIELLDDEEWLLSILDAARRRILPSALFFELFLDSVRNMHAKALAYIDEKTGNTVERILKESGYPAGWKKVAEAHDDP